MTTLQMLTAASLNGEIPATRCALGALTPRARAAKAVYVGALSRTDERSPDAQNSCHPLCSGNHGAPLARAASMGPKQANNPAKMIATSMMGAKEKPLDR